MEPFDLRTLVGPAPQPPPAAPTLPELLDRLPDATRAELRSRGLHQRFEAGDALYRQGQHGDDLIWLVSGQVSLERSVKGSAAPLRRGPLHAGQLLGEEALLGSGLRRDTALATVATEGLFIGRAEARQSLRRAGLESELEAARRRWQRSVLLEELRASPLLQALPAQALARITPRLHFRAIGPGEVVYREGEAARCVYLIGEGLVKVGRRVGTAEHIRAYLTVGDVFGDLEVLDAGARRATVTALGPTSLLEIPADLYLRLCREHPQLEQVARRLVEAGRERARGGNVDLLKMAPRLDVAQSLLMIDLNLCVRCGSCAWSCNEVHGASRLVRRGELIHLQGAAGAAAPPAPFLVPSSCQHCTDAVCMEGCPTGAIGRDLQGEVFVQGASCIGCGDCAKRCPWDNISMMDLPAGDGPRARAVKCDNCRGHKVSACSHSCPTGALRRVRPQDAFEEVRELLSDGRGPELPSAEVRQRHVGRWVFAALVAAALGYALANPAPLRGGSPMGVLFGAGALATVVVAALLSARKRGIRWIMVLERGHFETGANLEKAARPLTVSLATWVRLHIATGLVALTFALVHGGPGPWSPLAAALMALFFGVVATGAFGAIVYAAIPPLLTAIEETPFLVEDLEARRQALKSVIADLLHDRPPAVHRLWAQVERELRDPTWLWRIYRGRWSLPALVREVKGDHRAALAQLKGHHRQAMDQLIAHLAEGRHLQAQRHLHRILGGWLQPHILLAVAMGLLLTLHLIQVSAY